jgi:hypothetical protein
MQRSVTVSPTCRLLSIASTSSPCSKTSAYQRKVKPSGGKLTKARVSNEIIRTMIEGATSNRSENTATARIRPMPSASDRDE